MSEEFWKFRVDELLAELDQVRQQLAEADQANNALAFDRAELQGELREAESRLSALTLAAGSLVEQWRDHAQFADNDGNRERRDALDDCADDLAALLAVPAERHS